MEQNFDNFTYNHLTHLQIGRIGEYWVKIWLTLLGFDTYYNDVDDKGIDFILRIDNNTHIDIQVKTVRENTNYVFVTKNTWRDELRTNLYLALVLIENNKMPKIYLIPSLAWKSPNDLLIDRDYGKDGQISKPEWGINISKKNMHILEQYDIVKIIQQLKTKPLSME